MIFVYPVLYFGYKVVRKTKIRKPEEVDLVKDLAEIEEYQNNYIPTPPRYVFLHSLVYICVCVRMLTTVQEWI